MCLVLPNRNGFFDLEAIFRLETLFELESLLNIPFGGFYEFQISLG